MKIYLAGPMRGYPQFNFPEFDKAASALRASGHEVFSPAEHDRTTYGASMEVSNQEGSEEKAAVDYGFDIRKAMEADLTWICRNADAVALLPGWKKSRGATAEQACAIAINIKVVYLDPAKNYALEE